MNWKMETEIDVDEFRNDWHEDEGKQHAFLVIQMMQLVFSLKIW